jgi:hypothetical protein
MPHQLRIWLTNVNFVDAQFGSMALMLQPNDMGSKQLETYLLLGLPDRQIG